MTMDWIRLLLAAAMVVLGVVIAVRTCALVAATGSYGQVVPGLVLGAALVALGSYRIVLAFRARNAQRR
jgi:hypothetical protein